ncbi:MAG: cytochrome c biogenesis protein CcdA [Alcanivorax sp.]|nr:cytochrome c biogenesis protein CcdA [Alcanivorax sp.]
MPAMFVALLAGLVSFLSPCVLPIVPPYLAFMSGLSLNEMQEGRKRGKVALAALFFVLGLSTIFVLLGFTASWLGSFFLTNQVLLGRIAGAVVIVFGLHFLGVFRIGFLDREMRMEGGEGGSAFGAYILGLAFAFGWTPCIGPVLGSILAVSATSGADGMALLAIYSAGLGLPFLIIALFTNEIAGRLKRIGAAGRWLYRISGGLMVLMGIGVMTGQISRLAFWLLETFPALGTIG